MQIEDIVSKRFLDGLRRLPAFGKAVKEIRAGEHDARRRKIAEIVRIEAESMALLEQRLERRNKAARAFEEAKHAFEAAQAEYGIAQAELAGAETAARHSAWRLRLELVSSSDPAIGELDAWSQKMAEEVQGQFKLFILHDPIGSGRGGVTYDSNAPIINAALKAIRQVRAELAAMREADYGADPRPALEELRSRILQHLAPLGILDAGPKFTEL